jgi:hypothetical protein
MKDKLRIGNEFTTNEGYKVEIIEYINSNNCTIKFETGLIMREVRYCSLQLGKIKNPFHRSVFGVGYLGIGKYKSSINHKEVPAYSSWRRMLERCYDPKYHKRKRTYIGCEVHPDWHNYQVFAEWYYENNIKDFQLDKDILVKGNKIYGPDTCCFVPLEINTLLVRHSKCRGAYPIGVGQYRDRFKAVISKKNKDIGLGIFETIELAFMAYKREKEGYIREVADKWKHLITPKVYDALINYEVEITD